MQIVMYKRGLNEFVTGNNEDVALGGASASANTALAGIAKCACMSYDMHTLHHYQR